MRLYANIICRYVLDMRFRYNVPARHVTCFVFEHIIPRRRNVCENAYRRWRYRDDADVEDALSFPDRSVGTGIQCPRKLCSWWIIYESRKRSRSNVDVREHSGQRVYRRENWQPTVWRELMRGFTYTVKRSASLRRVHTISTRYSFVPVTKRRERQRAISIFI